MEADEFNTPILIAGLLFGSLLLFALFAVRLLGIVAHSILGPVLLWCSLQFYAISTRTLMWGRVAFEREIRTNDALKRAGFNAFVVGLWLYLQLYTGAITPIAVLALPAYSIPESLLRSRILAPRRDEFLLTPPGPWFVMITIGQVIGLIVGYALASWLFKL